MPKQKLAILIYSLGGGGAERVLLTLLPFLQEQFDVHLFLLEDRKSYQTNVKYEVIGASKVSDSSLMKLFRIPFLAYMYAKKLKEEQIELSFSLLNRPNYINILASLWNSKIKTLLSEHATPSLQYKSGLSGKVNRFLIQALYPKAKQIISVSKGVKEDVNKKFKIQKDLIRAVYNPFCLKQIELDSKIELEEIKKFKQHKQEGRKIFLAIGRLDSGKNHRFLIEAMATLESILKAESLETKDSNPSQTPLMPLLLILGEGELQEELHRLILEKNLGEFVQLCGFVKNPYAYLQMSDALVSASLYEGFLNILVESLALGIPAISSDCPSGPREILQSQTPPFNQQSEQTPFGILFPIPSGSSLSEKVCLESFVKVLYDFCYGRYLFDSTLLKERAKEFDEQKIASIYLEILEKL